MPKGGEQNVAGRPRNLPLLTMIAVGAAYWAIKEQGEERKAIEDWRGSRKGRALDTKKKQARAAFALQPFQRNQRLRAIDQAATKILSAGRAPAGREGEGLLRTVRQFDRSHQLRVKRAYGAERDLVTATLAWCREHLSEREANKVSRRGVQTCADYYRSLQAKGLI
jgi:hypothetical protein